MENTLTPEQKRNMLETAEYNVRFYSDRMVEAEREAKEAQERLERLRGLLKQAEALRADQENLFGEEVAATRRGPYAGLTLREAILKVIRERAGAPVTFRQLVEELQSHNYTIESQHPSRSIHAALIGVTEVEKIAPATYRWLNGSSPNRPEEPGRGNAQRG